MIDRELLNVSGEMIFYDGFDAALIGTVTRATMVMVALYDREKCIKILMDQDHMDYEEAEEFLEYNFINAYLGEFTPAFAMILTDEEKIMD